MCQRSCTQRACCSVQALRRCQGNVDAALELYEKERLPDLHALFYLDLTAIARLAGARWGHWNPHYLLSRWHLKLWSGLAQVAAPLGIQLGPPELEVFRNQCMPFRKASPQIRLANQMQFVCQACVLQQCNGSAL